MRLKYHCPSCGTSLAYEGLCWKCQMEKERQDALAWTPKQITQKQKNLIEHSWFGELGTGLGICYLSYAK